MVAEVGSMKYCCFEVTDRAGVPNVVDHHTIEYADEPIDGLYCVVVAEHPQVFHPEITYMPEEKNDDGFRFTVDDGGDIALRGTFMVGWDNLPTWQYFPEENRFDPIDPHELATLKHFVRRHEMIPKVLEPSIRKETELKHLRKAIKAIVMALPELQELPDVQKFLSLSDYIESRIQRVPKAAAETMDLHAHNGISRTRAKAIMATGVNHLTPQKELPKTDQITKEERVQHFKMNEARLKVEKIIREKQTLDWAVISKELEDEST